MADSGARSVAMLYTLILLAAPLVCHPGSCAETAIQGYSPEVSDLEARLRLARLLSYDEYTLRESEAEYRKVLKSQPKNRRINLELAHVLAMLGRLDEALAITGTILRDFPREPSTLVAEARIRAWAGELEEAADIAMKVDEKSLREPESLLALADTYAFMGHSARAWGIFARAVAATERKAEFRFAFAASMTELGDLYEAEDACRNWLKLRGQERGGRTRLAAVLAGMGRIGEARAIYRQLLQEAPNYRPAHIGMARVCLLDGEYEAAAISATKALATDPEHRDALALRAGAELSAGLYQASADDYLRLSRLEPGAARGPLGAAEAFCALGRPQDARSEFDKARRIRPREPAVALYGRFLGAVSGKRSCISIDEPPPAETARQCAGMGRLYQQKGRSREAAEFYRRAIEKDARSFPVRLWLAESLAAEGDYRESLEILAGLAKERSLNYRVLLAQARVLSQAGRYDEAFAIYDRMHDIDPQDPVPLFEKARAATWAKRTELAMETYGKLLANPADKGLERDLRPLARENESIAKLHRRLKERVAKGSIFEGYAEFEKGLQEASPDMSDSFRDRVMAVMNRRYPDYYNGRLAALEMEAKRHYLEGRNREAIAAYERLLSVQPGNAEAAFELAQAACASGRCREERRGYDSVMRASPLHQAGRAVRQALLARTHPALAAVHRYIDENGRGDLSGMARHDSGGVMEIPVSCRLRLRAGGGWREEKFEGESVRPRSRRGSLGASLVPFPAISMDGEWSYVEYAEPDLCSRVLGSGRINFDAGGRMNLAAGYERTEESRNRVAFAREIMADNWEVMAGLRPARRWEAVAHCRYSEINDGNSMQLVGIRIGREFGGGQRRLTVAGLGEYRDARSVSSPGKDLESIEHPYWTPSDHADGALLVQWRRDFSRHPYCGGPAKTCRIEARVGSNSEDDIYGRGEAGVDWEISKDWFLALNAMLYNSREWRAASTWSSLGYRF